MNLFFDLSGMRPDEFYRQRASRWTQASRDQKVYQEALATVESEAAGYRKTGDG